MNRAYLLAGVVAGAMTMAAPAFAQRSEPYERETPLTSEQSTAAWKIEAQTVAQMFNAPADNVPKIIDVYVKHRTGYAADEQKIRAESPAPTRAQLRERLEKLAETHRAGLAMDLQPLFTSEQREEALASLGAFSSTWDQMCYVCNGFGLSPDRSDKAQRAIAKHIADINKSSNGEERYERRIALENGLRGASLTSEQVEQLLRIAERLTMQHTNR